MKESLILWTSSIIVVFLLSYFKSVFGEYYPITGTFSVEGKKVTYKLDKVEYGDVYKIIIRTDYENLKGDIVVRTNQNKEEIIELISETEVISGEISKKKVGNKFNYYVILKWNDTAYRIPSENFIGFTFFGKIPNMINLLYYILLYLALILITRTGLEIFKSNRKTKKLLVITSIVLITLVFMISPLFLSYKFEYINKSIPPIQNLFPINFLVITFIWIATTVYVFVKKKDKPISLISAIVCLSIYVFS